MAVATVLGEVSVDSLEVGIGDIAYRCLHVGPGLTETFKVALADEHLRGLVHQLEVERIVHLP